MGYIPMRETANERRNYWGGRTLLTGLVMTPLVSLAMWFGLVPAATIMVPIVLVAVGLLMFWEVG